MGGSDGVTLGEEGHATFQIVNDGALNVDFEVDLAPEEVGMSVICCIVLASNFRCATQLLGLALLLLCSP